MQNSCLKTFAWWSRGSHFVENGYLSLRFPNMVKLNIHEHWTRVTRFNPLWVSDFNYKAFKYQYITATKQSHNATWLHILDPVSLTTSKWLVEWNTVFLVWYILHQHFFLVLMYCLKNDQECIINFLELIYLDLV